MKKIQITRERLELLAVIIIIVCGLSVFTVKLGGNATLTYEGGRLNYTGYVVNHRMNGQGKLTYPNGDTYEGRFVNGVFNGHGTFKSHMGWSYEGDFKKGQADGQGKLTAKDKKVYKGRFKQGIYQK
ncbi:membrane protein [Streptococcus macacae]|nr:membrane protein [Streptococcus macacae]